EWGRSVDDSGAVETEKAEKEQEERCLIYVAMTRARDHLFLSSPFPGGMQKKKPNLFADILDVVRGSEIRHEELRTAPEIEPRNPRGAAVKLADDGDIGSLLDRWSGGRARLEAAGRAAPLPVRGIEFVNPTLLHDFATCPLSFYYRHIVGADGGAFEAPREPIAARRARAAAGGVEARDLGVLLHGFLCERMSSGGRGDEPIADGLDEFARRYGFNGAQHKSAVEQATKRLNAFAETRLAKPGGEVWTELSARARLDRVVFRAVLDRVDVVSGGCRVVDYKFETERGEHAYQVQFYTWLLRELGQKTVNEALLCYLQLPTKIVPVDISPDAIGVVDRDARGLEEAVANGRFEPRPGESCDSCEFIQMCPYAGGSAARRE
ncbi:MAG: PD-(D/E)XK nuclease family protein, partial [bacterium]